MREAVRLWGPDVLWEEGTTLGGPCPQEDSSAKGSWEGLRRKQMEEEGTERWFYGFQPRGNKDWNRAVILEMARNKIVKILYSE